MKGLKSYQKLHPVGESQVGYRANVKISIEVIPLFGQLKKGSV